MHIPDGFLNGPVNATTFCISGGVLAVAVIRARRTMAEHEAPLMGVTAAFVFAAQMVNFPVGFGTSGHFLGAMLTAILLGPLNACIVMALVVALQCFVFMDGGVTALGSNIFNMAVVGAILPYIVFLAFKCVLPQTRGGFLAAAGMASWLSIVAASAACAIELAISGTLPLRPALAAMTGIHSIIGLGEALVSVGVLSVVLSVRPDLVRAWNPNHMEAVCQPKCNEITSSSPQ